MYQQVYDPVSDSLGASTIFAVLPLLTLFVLLGGLKWKADGESVSATTFKLNWLSTAGTLLLMSGLLTMAVLRISPARAVTQWVKTVDQLKWAILPSRRCSRWRTS